jgi:phytanoyl-CoA hydroxylase
MNTTRSAAALTQEQMTQWDREGYLLLKNAVPAETIRRNRRALTRVVDQMLAQLYTEKLIPAECDDLPFEKRFAIADRLANRFGRSWRKGIASPEVFDLHHAPALLDAAEQLCGTPGAVIGHPVFNGRPKLPGQQTTVVPWHQDSSYFGKESANDLILTCWIPLVPVNEANGCLQVVPGTHKIGLIDHHTEAAEGQFLEAKDGAFDERNAVTLPMAPGDVLVFGNLMMHRSLANTTDTVRWSIDLRFIREGSGPGRIGWNTDGFEWVLRSPTKPVTAYADWANEVSKWVW